MWHLFSHTEFFAFACVTAHTINLCPLQKCAFCDSSTLFLRTVTRIEVRSLSWQYWATSRSFKNRLNKYGPLTLTWVVPWLPSFQSQTVLWQTTLCFLSDKKLTYQLTMYGFKGLFVNFSVNKLCLTLSKVFETMVFLLALLIVTYSPMKVVSAEIDSFSHSSLLWSGNLFILLLLLLFLQINRLESSYTDSIPYSVSVSVPVYVSVSLSMIPSPSSGFHIFSFGVDTTRNRFQPPCRGKIDFQQSLNFCFAKLLHAKLLFSCLIVT